MKGRNVFWISVIVITVSLQFFGLYWLTVLLLTGILIVFAAKLLWLLFKHLQYFIDALIFHATIRWRFGKYAKEAIWFAEYISHVEMSPRNELPLRCPCCYYKTLEERAGHEVCPVYFWEDDGQDEHDADIVRGGPNYDLSLTQARTNYKTFSACEDYL